MFLPHSIPLRERALTTALHADGKIKSCSAKNITRSGLRDLLGVSGEAFTAHNDNLLSNSPSTRACRAQKELPHSKPQNLTSSRTKMGRHCRQTSCSWSIWVLLEARRVPRLSSPSRTGFNWFTQVSFVYIPNMQVVRGRAAAGRN
eukprot:6459699-Amphidinium_carterae.1